MNLAPLSEAIDELAKCSPADMADAADLAGLHRLVTRLDALLSVAVREFDARACFEPTGARDATAFLVTECRIPRAEARRRVRCARSLSDLPVCTASYVAGDITSTHVAAIASVRRSATAALMDRDEPLLVGHARTLTFSAFTRALRYWEMLADPDGMEIDDEARLGRRSVELASSFDGMYFGRITLDPIGGSIVARELDRRERELFDLDWAEARSRLGRDPLATDLSRTSRQRRADALVEMATRSAIPEKGRRPEPLFSVLVGYETLHGRICELEEGIVIPPGRLLPWLHSADLERAVFSPQARVEVSSTARLFTGAVRRALELRDRRCTHPYCEEPADRCQADHVVEYSQGGATTQENGRLLCAYHNRLRNRRPTAVTSSKRAPSAAVP